MILPLTYSQILKAPKRGLYKPEKAICHPHRTGIGLDKRVAIIEDYIGNGLMINEICIIHNVTMPTVCEIITKYFKKPDKDMVLQSKV